MLRAAVSPNTTDASSAAPGKQRHKAPNHQLKHVWADREKDLQQILKWIEHCQV